MKCLSGFSKIQPSIYELTNLLNKDLPLKQAERLEWSLKHLTTEIKFNFQLFVFLVESQDSSFLCASVKKVIFLL